MEPEAMEETAINIGVPDGSNRVPFFKKGPEGLRQGFPQNTEALTVQTRLS